MTDRRPLESSRSSPARDPAPAGTDVPPPGSAQRLQLDGEDLLEGLAAQLRGDIDHARAVLQRVEQRRQHDARRICAQAKARKQHSVLREAQQREHEQNLRRRAATLRFDEPTQAELYASDYDGWRD